MVDKVGTDDMWLPVKGWKGANEMTLWIKGPATDSEDLRSLDQTQCKEKANSPKQLSDVNVHAWMHAHTHANALNVDKIYKKKGWSLLIG